MKGEGGGVEIIVKTDVAEQPVVRIPVHVWPGTMRHDPGWLLEAQALIGRQAPVVPVDRLDGGEVEVGAPQGMVTMLVFSAHWCGHCDRHMPIIERIWQDYAPQGNVRFIDVTTGGGNGQGINAAVERWGLERPLVAIDRRFSAIRRYGVRAFPVVFLIDPNGVIEAVHGRWSNNETHNGLDDLEADLRTQLDLMLAGRTRADFPKKDPKPVRRAAAGMPPSAAGS